MGGWEKLSASVKKSIDDSGNKGLGDRTHSRSSRNSYQKLARVRRRVINASSSQTTSGLESLLDPRSLCPICADYVQQ